jgi:hypothetical protein
MEAVSSALGMVVVLMTGIFFMGATSTSVTTAQIWAGFVPNVPPHSIDLILTLVAGLTIPFNLFLAGKIANGNTIESMREGVSLATCVSGVAGMLIMIVGRWERVGALPALESWATHYRQHTTGNTLPATHYGNTLPATQYRQHTTGNTQPATHYRQHTTGNTLPATHNRQALLRLGGPLPALPRTLPSSRL